MTQTGDPLHNAMAERVNGTIKNDWLYSFEQVSFEETKEALARSIRLYNTARPHGGIQMKTPMQMLIPEFPNPLTTQESKEQNLNTRTSNHVRKQTGGRCYLYQKK